MLFKGLADLVWRSDAPAGSLQATFSRFGVVDRDGDLTLPSAFTDGQAVPMVWAHHWDQPVGKGVIRVLPDRAVFDGRFLETAAGQDAYATVKQMGELQEYSYGFQITDAGPGLHDGQPVRLLKALEVFEVSPVLVGAGIGTGTDRIKAAHPEEKPFPNEHACRLRDPSDFQAASFRRMSRAHEGKRYDVIVGRLTGQTTMTEQAYRYPTDEGWTAAQARAHCSAHDGARFEAATGKDALVALAEAAAELKFGRRFSAASRRDIQAVIDALAALIREDEAAAAEDDAAKTRGPPELVALAARFRRIQARHGGGD